VRSEIDDLKDASHFDKHVLDASYATWFIFFLKKKQNKKT